MKTGFFTVSKTGKRTQYRDFKCAALACYHKNEEDVIEVYAVNVNGVIETRERNLTTASIDYLSTFPN